MHTMRKFMLLLGLWAMSCALWAQKSTPQTDSTTFKGYYYNKEYNLYIRLDAYGKTVRVPDQELYGELPGFLGDNLDTRKWLFTDSEVKAPNQLLLTIINDYGSEDLTATLTLQPDGTFVLKQLEGSTLKVARHKKWAKLPKLLPFVKQ